MEANRASPRGHSVPASLLARPASPLACTCAGACPGPITGSWRCVPGRGHHSSLVRNSQGGMPIASARLRCSAMPAGSVR